MTEFGQDLAGQVALITGAGQGIGRTFANGFARAGAKVAIVELNEAKAKAVAAEIVSEFGDGAAIAIVADVADPDAVEAAVDQTLSAFGRIDICINNAAIFSTLKMRSFEEIPYEEWRDVMRVNVDGVMLVTKACAPVMRRNRHGRIINISSGVVTLGRPYYLHYVASKAAVVGMTRAMARELGATHAFKADDPDLVGKVKEVTSGGVDAALEFAGSVKALEASYAITRRGGTTVTAGLPNPIAMLTLPAVSLVAEERTIKGSYLGSGVPSRDIPRFLGLYMRGKLPVEKLLTHRIKLDDINEGFDRLHDGSAIRQVTEFN